MDEIGDYMISTVLSIDIDSSVQEAAMFMTANNIGSLLVEKFDEYVGIVTETELARKVLGKGLNRESIGIEEVMTSPVFQWIVTCLSKRRIALCIKIRFGI